MGGYPIRGKIIQYFQEHPGEIKFIDDLVTDIGDTRERIQNGITNILHEGIFPGLERVQSGGPYIYKGDAKAAAQKLVRANEGPQAGDLLEIKMITKKGNILVEDGQGILYKLVELEVE